MSKGHRSIASPTPLISGTAQLVLLDPLGCIVGAAQCVLHRLLARNRGVELSSDRLDHLVTVQPRAQRFGVTQDLADRLVVLLAEARLLHLGVLDRALPDGRPTGLDALGIDLWRCAER